MLERALFMQDDVQRVKSGIKGLDDCLKGGFVKGSVIEVAGSEGTFKSSLGLQFAVQGVRDNEKVVYLSFEEPKDSFRINAKTHGWENEFNRIEFKEIDLDEFFEEFKSRTVTGGEFTDVLATRILSEIGTADRVVIDTVTTLALFATRTTLRYRGENEWTYLAPSNADTRAMFYYIIGKLRSKKSTSLLLAEAGEGDLYVSEEILKYVSDTKIELKRSTLGAEASRTIIIHKSRHTEHPLDGQIIKMGDGGLEVVPLDS